MSQEDQEVASLVPPTEGAYFDLLGEELNEPGQRFLRLLAGSTDTAASFEFLYEDHTLGNALRHIIMKNPDVEFCGYSIPHPAEKKMHLRIQTYGIDEVNVHDVLEKGLNDLMDMCDVVIEKFDAARDRFKSQASSP